MKMTKDGKFLTTVPAITWWLSDKIKERRRKKSTRHGVDVIDNIERLYKLKKRGAISDKDFQELKEKLKQQF